MLLSPSLKRILLIIFFFFFFLANPLSKKKVGTIEEIRSTQPSKELVNPIDEVRSTILQSVDKPISEKIFARKNTEILKKPEEKLQVDESVNSDDSNIGTVESVPKFGDVFSFKVI